MAYQPKSYRKFLATSVAAAMVATVAAPVAPLAAEAKSTTFTDIAGVQSWAGDSIAYLVEKGALEGRGNGIFDPNANLKRGEAAKVLALALGLTVDNNAKAAFADTANHWSSKFVAAIQAQKPGVINGRNAQTFDPEGTITRQEMAKMVVVAYDLKKNDKAVLNFTDNNDWGKEFVEVLASLGVVEGVAAGKFNPTGNVTRAQTAVFVHRAEVEEVRIKVKEVAPVDPVDPVTPVDPTIAPGTVTANNQPTTSFIGQGSPLNEVFRFQVTSGKDEITFRSIQLKQLGTAAPSTIENVHLMVNGEIVSTGTVTSDNVVRLSRSVRIPANQTTEMVVLVDLGSATPTSTVQLAIESVDAFTSNAQFQGNFPLVGKSLQVIAANIGSLDVKATRVEKDIEAGDIQAEVGKFTLQARTEGVQLQRLRIEVNGGLKADELQNYTLYTNNGRDKVDAVATVSRDAVIFDLSKANIKINRSESASFVLKADPMAVGDSVKFEIANSYDLVAKGLNSGYNVRNNVTSGKVIGDLDVKGGEAKLRVSVNSPKSGDAIVASQSNYGVVREYDFISPGEDMTLKSAKIEVDWAGNALLDQVAQIQLYDAERNVVLDSVDVEKFQANRTGTSSSLADPSGTAVYQFTGINWLFAPGQKAKLQLRVTTKTSNASLSGLDIRLGNLVYDLEESRQKGKVSYPYPSFVPASAQTKTLSTTSAVEISVPTSASVRGYSLSGGLSNVQIGGFRFEAKDESLEVEKVKVKVTGLDAVKAEDIFANVRLVHGDEVVGVADFKTGNILEIKLDKKVLVEKGLSNRQIFKLQADVLEAPLATVAALNIGLELDEMDTRGKVSGISSTIKEFNLDNLLRQDGQATHNYRPTTVAVKVDLTAPIDNEAVRDARVLFFTMENIGKRNSVAAVKQFGFVSNYAYSKNNVSFALLDDESKRIGSGFNGTLSMNQTKFVTTTTGDTVNISHGLANIEKFYLTGDLFDLQGSRFRVDLDLDPNSWDITAGTTHKITPLFLSNEGPDFRIPRVSTN